MPRIYHDLDVESDFGGRFPYESKRLDVGGGVEMAYVDEGPRKAPHTFLLLHGNPTWGFLYRRFIERLWNRYRVVVPDHVGFGRSDKPEDPDYYTLERHIRNLDALVKRLNLRNVIPLVHDWGGPIGMGWATRDPQRVSAFVVLNTWAFIERPPMRLPWLFRFLFEGKPGARRIQRKNFFTEYVLGRGGTTRRLNPAELDAYRAPHPTPETRVGAARFPALIPQTHDVSHEAWSTMKTIETGLVQFVEHPALIVWAMRDVAFRKPYLERWKEIFPAHTGPVLLPDARHYLQEDAPAEILLAIENFVASLPKPEPVKAPIPVVALTKKTKPKAQRAPAPAPKPEPTIAPPPTEPMLATPSNGDSTTHPEPPVVKLVEPVSAAIAPPPTVPPAPVASSVDVQAETFMPPPTVASPDSHLVQNGDAQNVERVPKRDPRRVDQKKPRATKPRVVRPKDDTVSVKRAQRRG